MTAGLEGSACGGNQVFDDFETGWSGEDRSSWLEFADFELDFVFFGLADVRRIGDHEIESFRFEAVEQFGVVEEEAAFRRVLVCTKLKLKTRRVGFGNFERGGGVVGGVDLGRGEFLRERESDGAGAGADVGDFGILKQLCEREHDFDQVLGFGARDQNRGRDDQVESPEFLVTGDVLGGDTFGALC